MRPPCTSAKDTIDLRLPVLEHREVVLREIGDETAVAVARNHVGRHQRHAGAKGRLLRAVTSADAKTGSIRTPANDCERRQPSRTFATSIMAVMLPTRRQVLGTLAAAGTATLVEPGEVLARLAADVACVGTTPAGELLGTLPLFRNKPQPQEFGVKISGIGLDARLDHRTCRFSNPTN